MGTEVAIVRRCPKCGHTSRNHVYDALGKMRCAECPEEVCGTPSAEPIMREFGELTTVGIKHIREMTTRELVEEIMHAQWVALHNFEDERLRRMVAEIRVSSAKARIYNEAGVQPESWNWWGT